MEKEYNLLACPFCGGAAEVREKGKGTGDPKRFVRCTVCGARTAETVCFPKPIQDWNGRGGAKSWCSTCRFWEKVNGSFWEHYCTKVSQKRESCDFCSKWEAR